MIKLIDERIMELFRGNPKSLDSSKLAELVGEWKAEKATTTKCPYCIETIQKQATKCRSCFSTIEWFEVDDRHGACKEGESAAIENALRLARGNRQDKAKAKEDARASYLQARLKIISQTKCLECRSPLVDIEGLKVKTLQDVELLEEKYGISSSHTYNRFCDRCRPQELKWYETGYGFIAFFLVGVFFVIVCSLLSLIFF